jgi:putative copper export protein
MRFGRRSKASDTLRRYSKVGPPVCIVLVVGGVVEVVRGTRGKRRSSRASAESGGQLNAEPDTAMRVRGRLEASDPPCRYSKTSLSVLLLVVGGVVVVLRRLAAKDGHLERATKTAAASTHCPLLL